MPRPLRFRWLPVVLCAALHLPLSAVAATDDRFERIEATSRALAEALARLDAADDTPARAADLLAQARRERDLGHDETAQTLAGSAYGLLKERIRSVSAARVQPAESRPPAPEQASPAFLARRQAALELRAAALRVAEEKQADRAFVQAFDRELALADASAAAGRHAEATLALQRAYDGIKGTLVSLRQGETLVRSLNFASPEAEFRYERDRNDTFAMLVPLLAGEAVAEARAQGFLGSARALRAQAEEAGSAGRFDAGIELLERSSREYQKLIRNAGILLPG